MPKPSLLFIVNTKASFQHADLIKRYLKGYLVKTATTLPANTKTHALVILWSYKKIVPNIEKHSNVILFHTSDLPQGKGWAPLYHLLADSKKSYVISGIKAANEVDAGDIIVKASFPILPHYTAQALRRFDVELSFRLIRDILKKFKNKPLTGLKQDKTQESFYQRRYPENNKVDPALPLSQLIPHLKACEDTHPAYIEWEGEVFKLKLESVKPATYPKNITIRFFDEDS
ncbi:hypothetical protein K1X76_05125 [bacterium]|nr:hypothetical protein [bacterium]